MKYYPPAENTTDGGRWINFFWRHKSISIINHLRWHGWPFLVLREQMRTVVGGLDPVLDVFYDRIKDLPHGERCKLTSHPKAVAVERWVQGNFPCLNNGTGIVTVQPIFVDCIGNCKTDPSGLSWHNEDQAEVTSHLISRITTEINEILPEDIGIVTTHIGMKRLLLQRLGQEEQLDNLVDVNTTDSLPGYEKPVIFYVLATNKAKGPPYLDINRCIAGFTRHTDALFVVGDIRTWPRAAKDTHNLSEGSGEGLVTIPDWWKDLTKWFKSRSRVVNAESVHRISNGEGHRENSGKE